LAVDAALMLKHKKNALKELWSPQIEDTIRHEVDRQLDDALERNRERALSNNPLFESSSISLTPVITKDTKDINRKRDAILQNVVVIPSSAEKQ
jgi:hypothetical protein